MGLGATARAIVSLASLLLLTFSISVSAPTVVAATIDASDDPLNPTWLPPGVHAEHIGGADARDYFGLAGLTAGDYVEISTDSTVSVDDLEIELYRPGSFDASGTVRLPVESSQGAGATRAVRFVVPPTGAGDYILEIRSDEAASVPYDLTYALNPTQAPRLSGLDRYATSYAISRSSFATASVAVLASGSDFPDALTAAGLAGAVGGPVLLVPRSTTDTASIMNALEVLETERVYVVGGIGAVGTYVESMLSTGPVSLERRLGGSDRYHTSYLVAEESARVQGLSQVPTAFVVRGDDYADAMAAAPFAFHRSMPVLLTKPSLLSGFTAAFVENRNVAEVIVAGGEGAVSSEVTDAIEELNLDLGHTTTERWSGVDRYATASAVAAEGVARWSSAGMSWNTIGLATGQAFPDALSGGASAGAFGGPMLLTKAGSLPRAASDALGSNAVAAVLIFGGTGAVSEDVRAAVEALVEP